MRDIDMLVRAEDAERAHVLLKSLGYQMDPSPPPFDRHLPELVLPGHAGTIEIHTEALSFSARHALTTEEVWRHAEDRSFDGASFQVLPPEWHALHGLLHHQLSDRGHVRRLLGIKGLWEFARVGAEIPASGWDSIIAHAEQRTILDGLSSWSVQANRLFGLEAPDRLLSRETGRHHADATFRRARLPRTIRQALFVGDKVRFAFATSTLAFRYRGSTPTAAALRHLDFLWRRRSKMAGRWFGR